MNQSTPKKRSHTLQDVMTWYAQGEWQTLNTIRLTQHEEDWLYMTLKRQRSRIYLNASGRDLWNRLKSKLAPKRR